MTWAAARRLRKWLRRSRVKSRKFFDRLLAVHLYSARNCLTPRSRVDKFDFRTVRDQKLKRSAPQLHLGFPFVLRCFVRLRSGFRILALANAKVHPCQYNYFGTKGRDEVTCTISICQPPNILNEFDGLDLRSSKNLVTESRDKATQQVQIVSVRVYE